MNNVTAFADACPYERAERLVVDVHHDTPAGVAWSAVCEGYNGVEFLQRVNHGDCQIEKQDWSEQRMVRRKNAVMALRHQSWALHTILLECSAARREL